MLPLVYAAAYDIPGWDPRHRFPMPKFRGLHDFALARGLARPEQIRRSIPMARSAVERVHDRAYIDRLLAGLCGERELGLPWSAALVRRSFAAVGGTLLTARWALERGLACHLGGGTHHAFAEGGAGFCVLNDVAIAARQLRWEGRVRRVAVIDLDVHQGDGTAEIHSAEPEVRTFSMHCAANYPFAKRRSDLDIALPPGLGDEGYLAALREALPGLLEAPRPDLVFYNAGVDPHADDLLGKLSLSDAGLAARDRAVIEACLGAGVPVACVIGGGYSRDLPALIARHALVLRVADELYRRRRL